MALTQSELRELTFIRQWPAPIAFTIRNPGLVAGSLILLVMLILTVGAPYVTPYSPLEFFPEARLKPPSSTHWFGGDAIARDLFSRTLYGGRISLIVGLAVAVITTTLGLLIGLIAGYFRLLDIIIMRFMDGLMAIPPILLAIALMIITGSSLQNVVIAIIIPQMPRVVRLVRSMVLSLREMPYVEAAIASGTSIPRIVFRHILPNTLAPLVVQATYECGTAIIMESYLSFLGAGIPPETPSWGNIMAEGRMYFLLAPWIILIPGIFAGVTVLAINILGDNLRDMLDPRLRKNL